MDRVSKKFKKGEIYDSLRDLLPALTGRLFARNGQLALGRQEFWALHDISFQVNKGDAFGIIGHNGAGKSTILKLLCSIMKPTKGRIVVNGRLSALIEIGAGFHPDLTGRENIYLNGTILGMKRKEIENKFDEIVEFSGLEDFIDTPVKRYSSGMYARLGFSVAAHVDPDILVIDEVLSVGDYVFQEKSLRKLTSVIKGGATVIFVSHNMKAVADLCQKCILLDHGRITKAGRTSEVIGHYLEMNSLEIMDGDAEPVYISKTKIYGKNGETVRFQSGSTVWVDVEVKAREKLGKLAVVILVKDGNHYQIFDTSSEQLGAGSFSLEPGCTYRCTFELTLHLGPGTFHLGALIHRFDIQKDYYWKFPAATIYVHSQKDMHGVVNLNPKVVNHEVCVSGLV